MAKDPVWTVDVSEPGAKHQITRNDKTYYFCSEHCQETFSSQPETDMTPRRKGIFTRFLERLAKENKQTFGNKKPNCH